MTRATLRAIAWACAAVLLVGLSMWGGRADGQVSAMPPLRQESCPASLDLNGNDYHGLTISLCNFSSMDLRNANFKGATLLGVLFIKSNLAGADFSGATFWDGTDPSLPNDFTFANLTGVKFVGAKFTGTTYFTHATVTCADFSQTILNNGNAVFGDLPLVMAPPQSCRTKFQQSTMNCEFVAQWAQLDLTDAVISACTAQFRTAQGKPGHDFSGGIFRGVVFDNLDLTGSQWTGAVLERASFQGATLDNATGLNGTVGNPSRLSAAKFNNASVQNVDMSNAQLYGADFTNANLTNSSLAGAFLSANTAAVPPIEDAARFDGAHLKNVTLANAKLQSVSFRFASFYGSFGGASPTMTCPSITNQCTTPTGFTCACATASGADLTGANFESAFLFGVDFTGKNTIVNGTSFGSAILTGSRFDGASFQVNGGAAPNFTQAVLSGVIFSSDANLANASFLNAFVDFGAATNPFVGNDLYFLLGADYTRFRGWSGAATPCVMTSYAANTVLPASVSLTCPNGDSKVCGVGTPAPNANPNWKSQISIDSNSNGPKGWYGLDATYDKAAAQSAICGNNEVIDQKW